MQLVVARFERGAQPLFISSRSGGLARPRKPAASPFEHYAVSKQLASIKSVIVDRRKGRLAVVGQLDQTLGREIQFRQQYSAAD
jgi:hypothetical protein